MKNKGYIFGLKKGIPIAMGYLSVSFGFGITAILKGLAPVEAILISMTNLTSAGQVAGVDIIAASGGIIEMLLTQLIINLRYSLMGLALTQRLDGGFNTPHRLAISFGITDEVFAVAALQPSAISKGFMYGLITLPYIGWTAGTILGVYAGRILPESVCAALGLAIYSMFIAIVVPPARESRGVLSCVAISAILSCLFYYLPIFSFISQGFSIIICAFVAAGIMAWLKPIEQSA